MSASPRALAAAALAALALAGCGREELQRPARVRLVELAGTLHELPRATPRELLREEFDALPQDWFAITRSTEVLAGSADDLQRELGREDGRSFMTLSGRLGALYQLVPVEPDTPYLFRGTLRARGLVPAERPFHGARFWVAETQKRGAPAELFSDDKQFDRLLRLPAAESDAGWRDVRQAFRTRATTSTLIVSCLLAVDEELEAGAVDFDRLQLERIEDRELWELLAAEAVVEAHRGERLPPEGDWRARRRVGVMLGGEHRPALLLLPGERIELSVEVPEAAPELVLGLGPWPAGHADGRGTITHWLRVDGQELLRVGAPAGPLVEERWREVAIDLARFAGRRVRLELGVEGELPGVFGAPQVVARGAAAPGWNVLFVSIDTLRADRVGAYGGPAGLTPALDALARESLVFTDMTANAPYTLPAHATLFSGQFPSVHGVENRDVLLSPRRTPLLAAELAERGWRTQAFAAGGFLAPELGFHAGFDGFSVADPLRHPGSRYFADFARHYPDQDLSRWTPEPGESPVRRWLAEHAREPFFLFLHTYEVHDYDPPPGTVACAAAGCTSEMSDFRDLLFPRQREPFPGTPADRTHLVHLYEAALRHVDRQLGEILEDLRRLGLRERTLVVVTSDHGEEWFERGRLQHGKTLYEELLRIPWILRIPGHAPGRLDTPAMQVDVTPTILGALGLPLDPRMQGLDLLASPPRARPLWAEVEDRFVNKSCLRVGPWKLVHGPPDPDVVMPSERPWELYDVGSDPGETRDLAASEPQRLAELRAQLEGFQEHLRALAEALGPKASEAELQEGTRKLLEDLGY